MAVFRRHRDEVVLFVLALFVRAVYFVDRTSSVYFDRPILDELWIHQWARALAAGEKPVMEAFFRAPLYPYLVAGVYRLFGPHPMAVEVLQHLMGAVSVVVLYRLTRRLAGRAAARLAGGYLAFYWVAVFFEGELLIATLAMTLGLVSLGLLVAAADAQPLPGAPGPTRAGVRRLVLAGLAIGVAAIARPNFLALVPLACAWPARAHWSAGARRGAFRAGGWVALGVMGPVLVVCARNIVVAGDPVLIASQGGLNFYVGNGPDADGKTASAPAPAAPLDRETLETGYRDNVTRAGRAVAEAATGRSLRGSEVSAYWIGRTLESWRADPARAAGRFGRKLLFLVNGFEVSDNKDLGEVVAETPSIRLAFVRMAWLLPLAWVGVWACFKTFKKCKIIVWFALLYGGTIWLFFVNARMRLPIAPAIALLAALGTLALWSFVRGRSRGVLPLALLVIGTIVTNTRPFAIDDARARPAFRQNRATVLLESGDCLGALAAYDEALALDPAFFAALYGRARALDRCGDRTGAIRAFESALARWPEQPDARFALAALLLRDARHAEAAAHYAAGLESAPDRLSAWMNYGYTLAALGRLEAALAAWKAAARLDPGNAMARTNIERARAAISAAP